MKIISFLHFSSLFFSCLLFSALLFLHPPKNSKPQNLKKQKKLAQAINKFVSPVVLLPLPLPMLPASLSLPLSLEKFSVMSAVFGLIPALVLRNSGPFSARVKTAWSSWGRLGFGALTLAVATL